MPENEMKPCPEITDEMVAVAAAIEAAEVGYALRLTKLVDGVSTYTLKYDDATPAIDFEGIDAAHEHIRESLNFARASAAISAWNARVPAQSAGGGIEALGSKHFANGTRWKHVKTGGRYTIVGACQIEAANTPAYLYRSDKDGTIWARPMDEFLDGRFERLCEPRAVLTDTAREGWQPIETAPKDGTPVDIWALMLSHGWPTRDGQRFTHCKWGRHDADGSSPWGDEHWRGVPPQFKATHWRALPAAPSNVGTGEGA